MLMTEKTELRRKYKQLRNAISESDREEYNKKILVNFIESDVFKQSEIILSYVSYNGEADTFGIIDKSLSAGKKVAIPYCHEKEMYFYSINSLNDLEVGKYGILTVNPEGRTPLNSFEKALCIVPALSFDVNGNRLGYGGGYYDRFLADNNIISIGLCFGNCLCDRLPTEKHDIKVNYILNEKFLKKL